MPKSMIDFEDFITELRRHREAGEWVCTLTIYDDATSFVFAENFDHESTQNLMQVALTLSYQTKQILDRVLSMERVNALPH